MRRDVVHADGAGSPDPPAVLDVPAATDGAAGSGRRRSTAAGGGALSARLADVLAEFARTLITDFPIQAILDHLVTRIVSVLPVTSAGVTLISAGSPPRYIAASDPSALRFEQLQAEIGDGPCVQAWSHGEPVSVPDLSADRRFPGFQPLAVAAGLQAVFTFPLRHGDTRLGALDLYRDVAGPLVDEEMAAGQTLADVASAYLINAQSRADLLHQSTRAREAALHDDLTGLPNRLLLHERLERALVRSERSGGDVVVIFVDLDDFKAVNDTFGHQVGDEVLVAVAARLLERIRPCDTVARLAGDEFVIVLEGEPDASATALLAQRVAGAFRAPFPSSAGDLTVHASLGHATGTTPQTAASLLRDADLAMYLTKRRRRR